MRYITIPPKQTIHAIKAKGTDKPLDYGLIELLDEYVWGDPVWRETADANEAFERVFTAFEGKDIGDVVALEAKDFEILKPLAIMEGKPIARHLAPQFNRIMRSLWVATSKPVAAVENDETNEAAEG